MSIDKQDFSRKIKKMINRLVDEIDVAMSWSNQPKQNEAAFEQLLKEIKIEMDKEGIYEMYTCLKVVSSILINSMLTDGEQSAKNIASSIAGASFAISMDDGVISQTDGTLIVQSFLVSSFMAELGMAMSYGGGPRFENFMTVSHDRMVSNGLLEAFTSMKWATRFLVKLFLENKRDDLELSVVMFQEFQSIFDTFKEAMKSSEHK